MLTELEKNVMASIQTDIPVTEKPYGNMAQNLGISEETFLLTLKDLCDRGVIRRFGATIRHQKSGFSANAMVAWQVDENRIDAIGKTLASFSQVTHCYQRPPNKKWPYNLYTMIHAKDKKSCYKIAEKLASSVSIDTYTLLFSRRELKKTSMQYFPSDEDD
jgi:siroheme decarboxylase